MRPTLNIILDYLEESGKIEKEVKGILWIRQKEINNELRKRLNEDELIKMKTKIIKILKKNDVVKAGIFGSYARGEAKKDSDIDILIKFKGSKSLFDLVRVERELKEALNVDVDLITYNSINPHLKESILRDEVKII